MQKKETAKDPFQLFSVILQYGTQHEYIKLSDRCLAVRLAHDSSAFRHAGGLSRLSDCGRIAQ